VNDRALRRLLICGHCLRPASRCLCALARPTPHQTPVLVLQHPQEQRHVKNSVALLRLCLTSCEVVVGERFEPDTLSALLHRPGCKTRLLYPDVPVSPAPAPAPAHSTAAQEEGTLTRLVVIDATWRKSLRMLLEHPLLASLPRMSLSATAPTRYRVIRAARRADQISTLEATVQALSMLEGPGFQSEPVLDAFDRFVDHLASLRRPRVAARQPQALASVRAI
jgi:DTW domain-containing protein YfiP